MSQLLLFVLSLICAPDMRVPVQPTSASVVIRPPDPIIVRGTVRPWSPVRRHLHRGRS